MVKREAAVTTGVSKKIKVDPITEKCDVVFATLEKSATLPKTTCDMLKSILPLSLGICQNDRHKYQQGAIEAVARELAKIEEKHQSNISEEEAANSRLYEEKQKQEATLRELETTLGTKQAMLQKSKLQLHGEATAFQNAKCALKRVENSQENHEKQLVKVECKKSDLEGILQGTFQSLKEGSVEKEDAPKLASELVARLKGLFDINESLATTIPCVLGKEPVSRGPFDIMAIQHVEEEMEKHLTEWKAVIRDAEAVRAEHVAEVNAAREAFEAAREQQAASAEMFTIARKDMEEVEGLIVEAKKTFKGMPAKQQKAEKKLQDARDKLDFFRQGPLSVFAELRDRNQMDVESSNLKVVADDCKTSEAETPMAVFGA